MNNKCTKKNCPINAVTLNPDCDLKSCPYRTEEISEDCISRKAVINELKLGYFSKELQEGKNDPCVIDAMVDWAIRLVKHQPSITPKPETGKWIVYPNNIYAHLVCSKCLSNAPYDCETNYCPSCGLKMEVEE